MKEDVKCADVQMCKYGVFCGFEAVRVWEIDSRRLTTDESKKVIRIERKYQV